jgi:hypothetical protein
MDRRKFILLMSASAAGIALDQAIPFGRVWSFPSKIVIAKPIVDTAYLTFAVFNEVDPAVATMTFAPYRVVIPGTTKIDL